MSFNYSYKKKVNTNDCNFRNNNRNNNRNNKKLKIVKDNKKNNYNKHYNTNNKTHKLNSKWTIYIHDIKERDWSLESYKKVFEIYTIEDFWLFFDNFQNFRHYMFFFMRNDIKPVYEDKENLKGGSWSYSISGRDVNETFLYVLSKVIGEILLVDNDNKITGLSLVPKKGFSILKIWLKYKNKSLKINTNDIYSLKGGRFNGHKF